MRLSQYLLIGALNGFSAGSLTYAVLNRWNVGLLVGYCLFSLWWIAGNVAAEIRKSGDGLPK